VGQLYVRELDKVVAVLLDGAAGARAPFFSVDSQWIGFQADGKLKKISVHGGAPIVLCVTECRDRAWSTLRRQGGELAQGYIFSTDWKLMFISYIAHADAFTSSSESTWMPLIRYLPMSAPPSSS
jgi:hypothetical protein